MTSHPTRFPVFTDPRGRLLPVEFADLDIDVQRAFVVTGTPEGSTRGGHVVDCSELLILLKGAAVVRLSGDPAGQPEQEFRLERVGESRLLKTGWHVEYDLAPGESSLLVLASDPYVPRSPSEVSP